MSQELLFKRNASTDTVEIEITVHSESGQGYILSYGVSFGSKHAHHSLNYDSLKYAIKHALKIEKKLRDKHIPAQGKSVTSISGYQASIVLPLLTEGEVVC